MHFTLHRDHVRLLATGERDFSSNKLILIMIPCLGRGFRDRVRTSPVETTRMFFWKCSCLMSSLEPSKIDSSRYWWPVDGVQLLPAAGEKISEHYCMITRDVYGILQNSPPQARKFSRLKHAYTGETHNYQNSPPQARNFEVMEHT